MAGRAPPGRREAYRAFRTITTRWMDNDGYGHVNNAVYQSYFDTAVTAHLIESGCLDTARGEVIGLIVETGCRFFAPLSFPDLLTAGIRVGHRGRTSVRYEVGLFRNDEPVASAEGHFVHVYVDRATNRPVAPPDGLARVVDALLPEAERLAGSARSP